MAVPKTIEILKSETTEIQTYRKKEAVDIGAKSAVQSVRSRH